MARLTRLFSSVAPKGIPVYEAKEFSHLSAVEKDFLKQAPLTLKDKYYQFLPFYLESKLTTVNKRFILKMELYAETEQMQITCLELGKLFTKTIPLENIVPVTPEEFEVAHTLGKMIQPPEFVDLEMVYLNKPEQEFLVFDKTGEWKEEGVNHEALSMEKRFAEHKWLDFTSGPKADLNGGNVYTLY